MDKKFKFADFWKQLLAILITAGLLLAGLPPRTARADDRCQKIHTIAPGETLNKIARKYNIPVGDILRVNRPDSPDDLAAGQKLCIPWSRSSLTKKGASGYSVYRWSNFSAVVSGTQLVISGKKFPPRTTFYVRVRGPYFSIRVGGLRTSSDGQAYGVFRLPKGYPHYRYLEVCLKNVYNNATYCKAATVR